MALLPGLYTQEFTPRRFRVDEQALVRGKAVVLEPDTQSPLAPAHWIPEGTVVVRRRGSERFVHATHPAGERNRPASVSALAPADAAWGGSLVTVSLADGLGLPVRLPPGVADNAAAIDALNQAPGFAALFLADEDAAGRVRIRTRKAGAGEVLHVRSSLDAAFGPEGTAAHGLDADYRVTDGWGDVLELPGRPIHAVVPSLLAGHFEERELIHLTPEARVVFARRGSIFR
ncbi:MAG: hypothetical protein M9894_09535 [Planctomycetes bacterium]|nr:hypothetical protein [Planctomycetota bacterium]